MYKSDSLLRKNSRVYELLEKIFPKVKASSINHYIPSYIRKEIGRIRDTYKETDYLKKREYTLPKDGEISERELVEKFGIPLYYIESHFYKLAVNGGKNTVKPNVKQKEIYYNVKNVRVLLIFWEYERRILEDLVKDEPAFYD